MTSMVARQGDLGSHGNVLMPGSTNVLVNGRPAHRQYDQFICPIHGAGMTVLNCSTTVLVNSRALAHVQSIGMDEYPALVIQGSQNVMTGEK